MKWCGLLWIWALKPFTGAPSRRATESAAETWGQGLQGGWDGEIRHWALPLAFAARGWHCKMAWHQSVMKSGFLFQVWKNLIWRCLLLSDKLKWYGNKESLGGKTICSFILCFIYSIVSMLKRSNFYKASQHQRVSLDGEGTCAELLKSSEDGVVDWQWIIYEILIVSLTFLTGANWEYVQ